MPTTGAPWNISYPDDTYPVAPLEGLFSAQAVSLAVALTSAQTTFDARYTPRVADQAARLALFPTPVQGNRVWRADLGYEEVYLAAYNVTTNPGGANLADWYPAHASAIRGVAKRAASGSITANNGAYTDMSANAGWSTALAQGGTGLNGMVYANGWVPTITGFYRVTYTLIGAAQIAAGITVNAATVSSFTQLYGGQVAPSGVALATGTAVIYITAGQIVRLFAIGLAGAVAFDNNVGHLFAIEWVGPARG